MSGPNREACAAVNGERHRGCVYFDRCLGKCFTHCDLWSDHTCGQCANFEMSTALVGHCPHYIGSVSPKWKTNCPHFCAAKEGEPRFHSWVERYVRDNYDGDSREVEARSVRVEAREIWFSTHP